jgi:hypothetical protein
MCRAASSADGSAPALAVFFPFPDEVKDGISDKDGGITRDNSSDFHTGHEIDVG